MAKKITSAGKSSTVIADTYDASLSNGLLYANVSALDHHAAGTEKKNNAPLASRSADSASGEQHAGGLPASDMNKTMPDASPNAGHDQGYTMTGGGNANSYGANSIDQKQTSRFGSADGQDQYASASEQSSNRHDVTNEPRPGDSHGEACAPQGNQPDQCDHGEDNPCRPVIDKVVHLDDDALAGGNPGGIGDVNPDTSNTVGVLTFNALASSVSAIVWETAGAPVGFTYVASGSSLLVKQDTTTVMTLTLNAKTGAYTVTQNAPVLHAPGLDENNQLFDVGYKITVKHGNDESGKLVISVNDDTPTVCENAIVHLDDDALAGGNPGGLGDATPDTAHTTSVLGHSYGADGAGSITWLTVGAPAGFAYVASGSDLLVKQNGTTVMTLTLNTTTGAYVVTQNAPVMHSPDLFENNQSFSVGYKVTDKDGDPVVGSLSIIVNDDTPTVSQNAVVKLDDDALAGGNPGGIGDTSPDTANTTGVLSHSYGADGAGSIAWLMTGAPTGFAYVASGTNLLINQGLTTVMTLTVNSTTGAYTVTQNAPVMHQAGLGENTQSFEVKYSVTDKDGDPVIGKLAINVNDDTPTTQGNDVVLLDDDALAGGNPGGNGDVTPNTAHTTGTLHFSYGADGAGSVVWLTAGAPAGFTYVASGNDLLVNQGAIKVMTLSLDPMTGAYKVVQNAPVDHLAGMDENSQAFTIAYQVTDKDGDRAYADLTVVVNDDTPTASSNSTIHLDECALPALHASGAVSQSGTLSHSYGADGPGSISWVAQGAPDGFTYELSSGGDLVVKQGMTKVMTASLDHLTGQYTALLNAEIMNAPGDTSQSFTLNYQISDHDSDTVVASIDVVVSDASVHAPMPALTPAPLVLGSSVTHQSDVITLADLVSSPSTSATPDTLNAPQPSATPGAIPAITLASVAVPELSPLASTAPGHDPLTATPGVTAGLPASTPSGGPATTTTPADVITLADVTAPQNPSSAGAPAPAMTTTPDPVVVHVPDVLPVGSYAPPVEHLV